MNKYFCVLFLLIGVELKAQDNKVPPVSASFSYKGQQISPKCLDRFTGDSSRFTPIWLNSDPCQQNQVEEEHLKIKEMVEAFHPLAKN